MTGGQDPAGGMTVAAARRRAAGRGRRPGHRHHRGPAARTGDVAAARRRDRVGPRPDRSRPSDVLAAVPGRHRADPRPGVRGREAPQAQARQAAEPPTGGWSSTSGSARAAATAGASRNCLSVQPVRHRVRPQDPRSTSRSCNLDYSCLDGDCPSFVTVVPPGRNGPPSAARDRCDRRRRCPSPARRVTRRRRSACASPASAAPAWSPSRQVLAHGGDARRAATCAASTRPGWRRRAAPVVSDLRSAAPGRSGTNKLAAGECDLYLACDLARRRPTRPTCAVAAPDRTIAVVSTRRGPDRAR